MLESESSQHGKIIKWSSSAKAFHIDDVSEFARIILPKYFRTSKFSSFQRNLNLYGFFKVRRGPDIDMYAHPGFMRGYPEYLSQLRKSRCTAQRKSSSHSELSSRNFVPVSPKNELTEDPRRKVKDLNMLLHTKLPTSPDTVSNKIPISKQENNKSTGLNFDSLNWQPTDNILNGGRLNLLAFALSSLED